MLIFFNSSYYLVVFSPSSISISSPSRDLHSYARPPPHPSSTLSPPRGCGRQRRHSRVNLLSACLFWGFLRVQACIAAALSWWCFFFLPPQSSSECGSAVSTRSSLSDDEDMTWSFSWPPTAWHCFLKGRHIKTNTENLCNFSLKEIPCVCKYLFYHLSFLHLCHKCERLLLCVIRNSSALPQQL